MKRYLWLLLVALLVAFMSFPASATTFYGDTQYPDAPSDSVSKGDYHAIGLMNGKLYYAVTTVPVGAYSSGETNTSLKAYVYWWELVDDDWVFWKQSGASAQHMTYLDEVYWSNSTIYFYSSDSSSTLSTRVLIAGSAPDVRCDGLSCPSTDSNKDNVCDDCGFKFVVERDYSPFTVKKFMNHIGQILTSAVSWVSDVGAAIISQPLLLAFAALPLCGLGIAVFRRLKETV